MVIAQYTSNYIPIWWCNWYRAQKKKLAEYVHFEFQFDQLITFNPSQDGPIPSKINPLPYDIWVWRIEASRVGFLPSRSRSGIHGQHTAEVAPLKKATRHRAAEDHPKVALRHSFCCLAQHETFLKHFGTNTIERELPLETKRCKTTPKHGPLHLLAMFVVLPEPWSQLCGHMQQICKAKGGNVNIGRANSGRWTNPTDREGDVWIPLTLRYLSKKWRNVYEKSQFLAKFKLWTHFMLSLMNPSFQATSPATVPSFTRP